MKARDWRKLVYVSAFATCFGTTAYADSLRCGRAVVKIGDSTNTLLKKCGKPADKFSSRITLRESGQQRQRSVNNWVYRSSGKKDRVISVYAGEVLKIGRD